ncbi:hypothetical protein PVBG_06315 [Plasmodium vivax Brazil I]|uniref:Variable surface protein Vir18 n=1 Tax=Plasmodium vivax (strain Brazil I) TaxID=1033975 RepID=A0A0J9VFZ7_PLAV1|nr:hypothetical protein PVBG_06315 [Plasmodium vivax Brazil I]
MAYRGQRNSMVNDMFKRLHGAGCTRNYINTKNEIEQKINTFNHNDKKNYCIKCNAIKKSITEKTEQLRYCYGLTGFQPIESIDSIKEFIDNCPDPPKCRYPPNKPVRKPDVSKGQESDSCTGHGKCKEKIVTQVEPKSKAASGITAGISQAGRSEEKASLKEDRGHSDGNELRDGKVISPSRPEAIPPSDPVRTQDEGSKSTVNLPSVSTEETGTPIQYVSSTSPSASIELGTTPSTLSPQSSATRDSHSIGSTQVVDLNKDVPTTNLVAVQTEGDNQLQNIPVDAKITHDIAHDKADATEISVETVSYGTSSRGEDADYREPRSEETIDRVTSVQTGDAVVDQGNTDSIASQIVVAPSEDLGGGDQSHVITTNESIHHTNDSDVDNTSVEEQRSELTSGYANKLGILGGIFDVIIENKENVINTSIPMGIVLLLSLLFKVKQNLLHQSNYLCYFIYI